MAVLTKEEFFNRLHEMVGTDSSDDAISFIEDMSDTYTDMERRLEGDGVDWERRYKELDDAWRERYRHRFFTGGEYTIPKEEDVERRYEEVKIDDLFKEKEGE